MLRFLLYHNICFWWSCTRKKRSSNF